MGKKSKEKLARRLVHRSSESEGGSLGEFQSVFEKTCLFIIQWGAYLVLFTPLIISIKFFFPFVAPKTIFFRVVLEIILAAYILLVAINSRYRPRINALTIALTLFLAVFILASFTGVNLSRSFWSTYERMTGVLTMLHLYAFFIILSSVFRKREDWEKLLGVSVIVGVLLSFYILNGSAISTRGGGTIGNTSFMAAYLLFCMFFAIILFLSNLFKKKGWPLFWQIFSGVSLLIMLPVLLNSSARGAIAAFFGGLFLLFLGYLMFSQKKQLKRAALAVILALIIFGVISAVFQPPIIQDKVKSTLRDMGSRFVVWEEGWKGFVARPVLGWGPENFNVVFSKYFNPCMSLPKCGTEVWFDRVHNIIFDTLVTTGILGLLSYLSIFAVAFYGLLKTLLKIVERRNIFIPLGLVALLVVYFFQNMLVFDMINTYLVFFLSLAFTNFLTQKEALAQEEKRTTTVSPLFASIIIIIFMAPVLWLGNIQPLIANYFIIKAFKSSDAAEASLFFRKSLDSWMEKYETREQFAQRLTKITYQTIEENAKPAFQKMFNLAEAEMEKSINENHMDFRPHLFLGELYESSYRLSSDKTKIKKAEEVLERAIELSPTNQQGYWFLAEAKLTQGKTQEMIQLLQKAVELEPKIGYSHWYLAMAYKIIDQYQLALEEVRKAGGYGYSWNKNKENLQRVIEIYQLLGKDPASGMVGSYELIESYQKMVELDPRNWQAWIALANHYADVGYFEYARVAAQKTLELKPDKRQAIEEFLQSLPE